MQGADIDTYFRKRDARRAYIALTLALSRKRARESFDARCRH
jgi:hypothetical protein